jgi:hypothetical protein
MPLAETIFIFGKMPRPRGSKNRKTLERERQAAQITAGGTVDHPDVRAVPTLRRIMAWHLGRADKEIAKGDACNPAIVTEAYAEARLTAQALAQYESPRLAALAVGTVTRKVVEVHGALGPRQIAPPPLAVVPKGDADAA